MRYNNMLKLLIWTELSYLLFEEIKSILKKNWSYLATKFAGYNTIGLFFGGYVKDKVNKNNYICIAELKDGFFCVTGEIET